MDNVNDINFSISRFEKMVKENLCSPDSDNSLCNKKGGRRKKKRKSRKKRKTNKKKRKRKRKTKRKRRR